MFSLIHASDVFYNPFVFSLSGISYFLNYTTIISSCISRISNVVNKNKVAQCHVWKYLFFIIYSIPRRLNCFFSLKKLVFIIIEYHQDKSTTVKQNPLDKNALHLEITIYIELNCDWLLLFGEQYYYTSIYHYYHIIILSCFGYMYFKRKQPSDVISTEIFGNIQSFCLS